MIDAAVLSHVAMIGRLIAGLESFAQGRGLDTETTHHIVARVISDMPLNSDEERLTRARNWVLVASA